MAQIRFDDKTLSKVKNRVGIYNQIKPPKIETLSKVIEVVFREWCKTHKGWTQSKEDESWIKFKKILSGHL